MMDQRIIADGITLVLKGLGVDAKNQHLNRTPERVARAWTETFASGYDMNIPKMLGVTFEEDYDQMVIVKDIPFCSMCVHHLLPFFGKAKIGYIPDGKVTGLSKLARVLDAYARRLQIQERLTNEVAQAIQKYLNPIGVGVIIEAQHLCMTERGVQKPGSMTITSSLIGAMMDDSKTRSEFINF